MTFYEECQRLRNFYSLTNPNDLELTILSKLVSISFYNNYSKNCLDTLPICKDITLDCSDLKVTYFEIEKSLSKILKDLDYYHFSITPVNPFGVTHKIVFKIM